MGVEDSVLGSGGASTMKLIAASDSKPVPDSSFRVYLLRVSTLESRGAKYELAWKQAPRGNTRRAEDGTPLFCEMAVPGTVFEGEWRRNEFLRQPEIAKALRTRERPDASELWGCGQYACRAAPDHSSAIRRLGCFARLESDRD